MQHYEIEELLMDHGIKPSSQRVVITEYLVNTKKHPTAEEVLIAIRDRLPVCISRATVYNTLNTLVEANLIKELSVEPGIIRYDGNRQQHHHFVDIKTGNIMDLPWSTISQLDDRLSQHFKIHNYQVTFYGELVSS